MQDYFDGINLKNLISDEAVACGAALQAAILIGDKNDLINDMLLMDVTPQSLGIETAGGVMTTMIKKNDLIPTKRTQAFTTYANNQSVVCIKVLEGESPLAKENNPLDKFQLRGIPPAPRGQPQIEVTFDIDANSMLNVSAVEKGTGIEKRIIIKKAKGQFSRANIVMMVNGAEKCDENEEKQMVLFESGSKVSKRNNEESGPKRRVQRLKKAKK